MTIIDFTPHHRAIRLEAHEVLDTRTIVTSLISHGYTPADAAESANTLCDALEEYRIAG